ncbi:MAG: cryptochrome/photolyase family protein [Waddliaceae bacterium]|nr:cryptochrome/photolyase family protein [Waddliaceae bacterium]
MKMKQSLFLIMGSHLFPPKYLQNLDHKNILMIEDFGLCTHFHYHKKKLVFFLESMRNHADLLRKEGFDVTYIELKDDSKKISFEKQLSKILKENQCEKLETFEIEDRFFREILSNCAKTNKVKWVIHRSPMFFHSTNEFYSYFSSKKAPRLRHFYELERKKRDLLMNNGEPLGGQFSFDKDNRKRLPKSISIPALPPIRATKHHKPVSDLVNKLFPKHPGKAEGSWLPSSRSAAENWLEEFLERRFSDFGPYEDAISMEEPFVFHSVLSPLLNIGLLTPEEVIEKALEQKNIPINSLEGFIRQVLGWREFIRGVDECFGEKQSKSNFFKHQRLLGEQWWTGKTGLLPVDHSIQTVLQYGYCHHIERLMILSNVMLLLEIHPQEVYRWFMEMFVDSADWVMGPNVYGMGQFSDGGLFATKPYICGSNYLRKMSDFPKGDWCDILDGLYWSFIDKRREFFSGQPRLNMMLATLDRMKEERRAHLFSLAQKFQEETTYT